MQWTPSALRHGDALAFAQMQDVCFVSLYDDRGSRIYASGDDGMTWQAQDAGLPEGVCVSTLMPHAGRLFAGTLAHGVLVAAGHPPRWQPAGSGLPAGASVLALASHDATLLAGTRAHGVFQVTDDGAGWRPASRGLPLEGEGLTVICLAAWEGGCVAAHPFGLHRLRPGTARWEMLSLCLPGAAVFLGLLPADDGGLLGWNAEGVYHAPDGGLTWAALAPALWRGRFVRNVVAAGGLLFAGLAGAEAAAVYESGDGGLTWAPCVEGLPRPAWSVHLAGAGRHLLAGVGGHGVWHRPLPPRPAAPALTWAFTLDQNDPNPFDRATMIRFVLHREARVVLALYDVAGRLVGTLLDAACAAGAHAVRCDGAELPPGLYTYTLQVGGVSQSRRMLVLR